MHKPLKGTFNEILAVALGGGRKEKFMANEAQRATAAPKAAAQPPARKK
jgi:hypothetical protein